MTPINLPPLLLDNERFREAMREREQWSTEACQQPAIIRHTIKSASLAALAGPENHASQAGKPCRFSRQPAREWPPLLRQLHQELCSSSQLRPIARILDTPALLPDPFLVQGGLWDIGNPLPPACLPQHPVTRLLTALRLDIVLQGCADVAVNDNGIGNLAAGTTLLTESNVIVTYSTDDAALRVWTEFYYSPGTGESPQ